MPCLSIVQPLKKEPPPHLLRKLKKHSPPQKKRHSLFFQEHLTDAHPLACTPCRCSTDATLRPRRPSSSEPNFPVTGNKAIPERSDQISAATSSSISFACNGGRVVHTFGSVESNSIPELSLKTPCLPICCQGASLQRTFEFFQNGLASSGWSTCKGFYSQERFRPHRSSSNPFNTTGYTS